MLDKLGDMVYTWDYESLHLYLKEFQEDLNEETISEFLSKLIGEKSICTDRIIWDGTLESYPVFRAIMSELYLDCCVLHLYSNPPEPRQVVVTRYGRLQANLSQKPLRASFRLNETVLRYGNISLKF